VKTQRGALSRSDLINRLASMVVDFACNIKVSSLYILPPRRGNLISSAANARKSGSRSGAMDASSRACNWLFLTLRRVHHEILPLWWLPLADRALGSGPELLSSSSVSSGSQPFLFAPKLHHFRSSHSLDYTPCSIHYLMTN